MYSTCPRSFLSGTCSTLKHWAPPTPIRFIASRSAVMPSFDTFPLTQCHQVRVLAESGGLANPRESSSVFVAVTGPSGVPEGNVQ